MVYKMHKCGSYNIHTIKTNKFKNIRIEIMFRNNIDVNTIAYKSFLFDLLTENNKEFNTRRKLILELEYLYNAILYSSSNRIGNMIINSIVMDFLNPKYTEDDYMEEAIKLPFDMIFNPNINLNEFDELTVNTLKNRIIKSLKGINEVPNRLAFKNAVCAMDNKSISSINILGNEDIVEGITNEKLLETYNNVLEHDYVDIFVIGDFEEDIVLDLIQKYAKFNTIKNHDIDVYIENKVKLKPLSKSDKKNIQQSHLVMLFNLLNLNEYEKKYVFNVYDFILGGGSLESQLYKSLRNDNSLCYSIYSAYLKFDNLLLVQTSVDKKNIKQAKELILKTIKDMDNLINNENLESSIKQIITSINSGLDVPTRIISNYYFNYLGLTDKVEDRVDNYKKVTLSDLKKISSKIKLNTTYVLEGDNNESN